MDKNFKHGGAMARRQLTTGEDFTGLAREVEKSIQADYDTRGPLELLRRDAVRLQTASELYWSALMGAAENGEIQKFESYMKTYGWLVAAAARVLKEVIPLQGKEPPITAAEVIATIKGSNE